MWLLSDMETTLKGKNLLLEEQILSFKNCPLLKRCKNSRDTFASLKSRSILNGKNLLLTVVLHLRDAKIAEILPLLV